MKPTQTAQNHLRPLPTPATGRNPGPRLPFYAEAAGCAGHDLLVLSARPDLAAGQTDPAADFLRRYLPGQTT